MERIDVNTQLENPADLPDDSGESASAFLDAVFVWSITPIFLLLAAWFIFEAPHTDVQRPAATIVALSDIEPGPRRVPMTDPPSIDVGGFQQRCNECHRVFESPEKQHRPMVQHTQIVLNHGMNDSCFNCHARRDREKLTLYSGASIGFDDAPKLCAQCHGTVFRDWQRGTHGKTLGSWDAASGRQIRLACNQCHDPHWPAYPRLVPLPPPNTMRMGPQPSEGEHEHLGHMPLLEGAERAREPKHVDPRSREEHP